MRSSDAPSKTVGSLGSLRTHAADRTRSQTVLLICVKYQADEETEQYLQSIRKLQSQEKLKALVVDNTVGANWARLSCQSDYRAVQAPQNLGYFGGARYGLSLYLEHNPLPDWVIISNVDLSIEDPAFLERLEQFSSIPDVGAIAPSIRSTLTGVDQNPFMRVRPSGLRMHMYKWLFRSWLLLNAYEGLGMLYHKVRSMARITQAHSASQASRESIYAPHGSFLVISTNYFERGGNLQFPEFLFGEEVYIAENMRRLGLTVLYDPSLQVIHREHTSTKIFKSRTVAGYVASSAAYCANTFFAPFSK